MKTNYYVNADILRMEFKISLFQGKISTPLFEMMSAIAWRYTLKHFACNPYRRNVQDCYQAAIEVLLTKWDKYDINKGCPFSWCTQVVKYAVYQEYNYHTSWKKTVRDLDGNHQIILLDYL